MRRIVNEQVRVGIWGWWWQKLSCGTLLVKRGKRCKDFYTSGHKGKGVGNGNGRARRAVSS